MEYLIDRIMTMQGTYVPLFVTCKQKSLQSLVLLRFGDVCLLLCHNSQFITITRNINFTFQLMYFYFLLQPTPLMFLVIVIE